MVSEGVPVPPPSMFTPSGWLVHRMERRGHGRVDVEKGVAGPRGRGRQWTAPLITCGMEKM